MTAKELVDQLNMLMAHGLNPGAIVKAYDGNSEKLEAMTGLLYGDSEVEICTDTQEG